MFYLPFSFLLFFCTVVPGGLSSIDEKIQEQAQHGQQLVVETLPAVEESGAVGGAEGKGQAEDQPLSDCSGSGNGPGGLLAPQKVKARKLSSSDSEFQLKAKSGLGLQGDGGAARLLTRDSPDWIADELVNCCMECGKRFTLTFRRSHCRLCGYVLCGPCTKFGNTEVKLCKKCSHNSGAQPDLQPR